jgi:hypothetical protein
MLKMKKILKDGLLITIGPWTIDFPVDPGWQNPEDIIAAGYDIINKLIIFSAIIAVAMIIVSGYILITATGDPDKIKKGQKTLTAAIVGFVIVSVVALIIRFVLSEMGALAN